MTLEANIVRVRRSSGRETVFVDVREARLRRPRPHTHQLVASSPRAAEHLGEEMEAACRRLGFVVEPAERFPPPRGGCRHG